MSLVQHDQRRYWLDDAKNVRKIIYGLIVCCILAIAAGVLSRSHGHFTVEGIFGFYGLFGFVACVALVLVAKWMRTFLMRSEEYYDPDGDD